MFAKHRIKPHVKHTTNGIAASYSLVEAGVGIAIPDREFLSPAAKTFIAFVNGHFIPPSSI
jgi:DNA-binding transcriptional LysR family regulator